MTWVNDAFVDEFMRIKIAEEDQREALNSQQIRDSIGRMVLGAGAFGVGAGLGGLVMNQGFPRLSPAQQAILIGGTGVLTAAGAMALKRAMEKNRELIYEQAKRDG